MSTSATPDGRGRFGEFGGRFVPETVMGALDELVAGWEAARSDPAFHAELDRLARDFVGRPTPLLLAERLMEEAPPGVRIHLKREDLNHTGAHKINNAVGQALLARRLGKHRIIAETGAGQHGVATATVCARFGLDCHVYMGEEDIRRQHPNVVRMHMLGAEVIPVAAGAGTLKDAMNEAIRDWITNVETTHYLIGSAAGPHPYPALVRELQIGDRAGGARADPGGGGPPARPGRGLRRRRLKRDRPLPPLRRGRRGAAAGRRGRRRRARHRRHALGGSDLGAARLAQLRAGRRRRPGAGDPLDLGRARLPRRRPRARHLKDTGRATYEPVTDAQALEAFHLLCRREGIIPALESSHALWLALHRAREGELVLVGLSGRGDKDVDTVEQREAAS